VYYAGSAFDALHLTTRPFNPGPNGKLKFNFSGAVAHDPAGFGNRGHVSGTLTCTKGGQEKSAGTEVLTYFPFETTYKTSVTGIKDPKRCTLHVSAWWDPVPTATGPFAHNWPHGIIDVFVYLKK
jgi:hypothetical protein